MNSDTVLRVIHLNCKNQVGQQEKMFWCRRWARY